MQHRWSLTLKDSSTNSSGRFGKTTKSHFSQPSTALRHYAILILVGLYLVFSIHGDPRRGRMMNYTSLAATALQIPKIGLGTFGMTPTEARPVIKEALSMGYRLFDCAPVYFNEKEIGDAFQEATNGVPRTDVFVTSKLASPFHRPEHVETALRKTLHDLRLGYLDLFLIHWPVAFKYVEIDPSVRGWENEDIDDSDGGRNIDPSVALRDTWAAMEALVDKGLVKHIGVANFPVILLHDLLSYSRISPAVNQVEIHPYNQQSELLAYCKSRGVMVQAYSPLGTPGYKEGGEPDVLSNPVLKEIAGSRGMSVAQLCLQWSLQRGCHVVAKSSNVDHMEENLLVGYRDDKKLSLEEMERIASLDRGYRFFRPEDWWKDMPVFH